MRRDVSIYVGLCISIGYTFMTLYATYSMSGAWIDGVRVLAVLFALISITSWSIDSRAIVRLDGGWFFPHMLVIVQITALVMSGFFVVATIRLLTQANTITRLLMAYKKVEELWKFKIDMNANGHRYIHCYGCNVTSYNQEDVHNLYCASCDTSFHQTSGYTLL